VFHSPSLKPLEFCVFPDDALASQELPYLFTSREEVSSFSKYSGTVFSSLPNEVLFHVRRLSLFERIRKLFGYD
jgi:hypothetical protein